MSLPVIVRAESELVAPIAPLTVTSPVPPVSVSVRVAATLPSTVPSN